MSDNNQSPADLLPIGLLIPVVIVYQNRNKIILFLEELLPKLMWIAIVIAAAVLAWLILTSLYRYLKKKYLEGVAWVANVNNTHEKYASDIKHLKEWVEWLKDYNRDSQREIKVLRAEIEKLKPKEKPKEEVVKTEAAAKAEEAAKQHLNA